MTSLGLLVLRLVFGGLLAGHGAQKLYGAFGGHGPEGTGKFFESKGIAPGREMAQVAGAAELTGGTLTALGFLWPLGPFTSFGPMIVAWRKVHWNKPIWNTAGGAELPLLNLAIASALTLTGPGAISVDRVLGIRTPWWLVVLGVAGTGAGVAVALRREIGEAVDDAGRKRAAAIRERQQMEEQELLDAAEEEPERMRSS